MNYMLGVHLRNFHDICTSTRGENHSHNFSKSYSLHINTEIHYGVGLLYTNNFTVKNILLLILKQAV